LDFANKNIRSLTSGYSNRAWKELRNGKYTENCNRYRRLTGDRPGLVEAFLKRGYNVVGNSRNITKSNPFPASDNLALVDGDIGDPKTAAKIVDTALSRFGRVDVLINNAGIFIPMAFTEYTTEDFNALVSTTLAGFLYVSQLSVKQMLRQKSGSIVNISTTFVGQPVAGGNPLHQRLRLLDG